ncbi:MAG: DNA-binding response regulator [Methylotenera sp. 24-45-7]|jgi:two-component system response regulator AtoC|nr:MAG: DNA-binding response regulator [Mehylophilales bacterium 35-46-6]OYY84502.1 MAG: DNA-binding response regulator [Methylophilales bacterium 16-45-9]OYZ41977.1 MAG: DNA-binding response regulator [Methylotenera sp. 24-45-7]OZA08381.1 MAG: DNA-binding response regulator [Methylotenera sp. 17-45-7]OZA53478.1 MAG: DNA-binding response regulator [Methylophilales bacterium 39-45-7]HQS37723.1 sigma-54 dependent transcriptional regulator [Methylotenera sp.]
MSHTIKTILAVDDEPNMLRLLEISLRQAGYKPLTARDGREALEIIRSQHVDCVVTDLHMPYMSGLQLLKAIRGEALDEAQHKSSKAQSNPDLPVIIVTAQGEVKTAIDAMKNGASDYILRPFDLEELELAISRALSFARLVVENQFLREEKTSDIGIVGNSPPMQQLFDAIRQVAPEKATVLIAGETGTGKELVARAIHAGSPRKEGLFVAVNCAAIPHEMLESELFGHEKGAFTGAIKERVGKFELADGGTLFLDEITEMPMQLQAKLLRALQENVIERVGGNRQIDVDIRVVAATNRDPKQAIADGKLREDLYYRLNVFRLDLPPLRMRKSDIASLAQHFLAQRRAAISVDAIQALTGYDWPGNVRELENVLERAAIISGNQTILPKHLPAEMVNHVTLAASDSGVATNTLALPPALEALERRLISEALAITQGNKSKAAKLLEISERSLWYKISQYEIH